MSKKSFWLCMALFALVYLALRLFWLDGDPGIAAAWEYGYNATDEGYYLDGGKEKYLWGRFVDLSRHEAFTYGFSPGTHALSYLSHLVFGLSTWTWRIPFFMITCLAWFVMFAYLARRSGGWRALALCVSISSIPMVIAYERTASNDVLIGSLTVMAYVLATGRAKWRLAAASLVTSLIVLIKPSVWALIPVVMAGVLQTPRFKRWWIDAGCFVAMTVVGVCVCKLLTVLSVLPDAKAAGISAWEVVKRTTTHYPLPPLFDFASHFKGLSAFPRDPSYCMLGIAAILVFVLPVALTMKNLVHRRLNGNTLLFAGVSAYVAAINVMNTQYTHYFIPALMMMPIMLDAAATEVEAVEGADTPGWRKEAPGMALALAMCAVVGVLLSCFEIKPQLAQQYYSRIYNFPAKNVYLSTMPLIAVFAGGTVLILTLLRGLSPAKRELPAWLVSALAAASVVFAAVPAVQLAPYMHQQVALYFAPMVLDLVASVLILVSLFGSGGLFLRARTIGSFALVSVATCYFLTSNWRQAACELIRPATHYHDLAAKELVSLLPKDAIVIGERANQMLMSLPIRAATTFAAGSNPIPVIQTILQREPSAKLYALIDPQHPYNLQHYREHAKTYALHPVKVLKMPSFGNGSPTDIHLCRIEVRQE